MGLMVSRQIRAALLSQLSGLALIATNVGGRSRYIDENALPSLRVWFDDETHVRQPMGSLDPKHPMSLRTAKFTVEISAKASTDIDDDLDVLRLIVEAALFADIRLGGLVRTLRIVNMSRIVDMDADRKMGRDTYDVEVDYLCRDNTPDVVISAS